MSKLIRVPTARLLLGVGALSIAGTTAAEVFTAPYSDAVIAYPLNPAVHLVKVLGIFAFATGLIVLATAERHLLGRWGLGAAALLAVATVAGATPYSIIEATLPTNVTATVAERQLEAIYVDQPWIGIVAALAMPLSVLSIGVLGVVAFRRRIGPWWVPVLSLAIIPLAVSLAAIGENAGLAVPHPPTWIFLGLSGYALALGRPEGVSPATAAKDVAAAAQ
jgi:hypothetical protein